jgi:hypothetical protein
LQDLLERVPHHLKAFFVLEPLRPNAFVGIHTGAPTTAARRIAFSR